MEIKRRRRELGHEVRNSPVETYVYKGHMIPASVLRKGQVTSLVMVRSCRRELFPSNHLPAAICDV